MKSKDLQVEVMRLRARCDALEAQVESLQGGKPPSTPRTNILKEPGGVTITRLPDRNASFAMPSADELRALNHIVLTHYPQLAANEEGREAFDGFCRAFLRIGSLGRDKLDDRYALTSWIDNATFWFREQQIYPNLITGKDFIAAVVAHGDIDYVPLDRFPYDCSAFGLRRDSSGRPATDGWRSVLAGRLRAPVPPRVQTVGTSTVG